LKEKFKITPKHNTDNKVHKLVMVFANFQASGQKLVQSKSDRAPAFNKAKYTMTNNFSPSNLYRETRISQKICTMKAKTHAMLRSFRLVQRLCSDSDFLLQPSLLSNVYDTLLPGR